MAARRARRSFGKIRKLPSGRFQSSYTDPHGSGRRHNADRTFVAKIDAEAWLAAEARLISAGDWTPPAGRAQRRQGTGVRLHDFTDSWLRERDIADSTRVLYRDILDKRILPGLGDEYLADITPAVVRAWWAARDKTTPTRALHSYRLLNAVMKTAVADGLIRENPCQIVGAGRALAAPELVIPTVDDLNAIVAEMPEKYRVPTLILAWCGLRFGEMIELRRKDLRHVEGTTALRLDRAAARIRGRYQVGSTKSEAGQRTVTVPPHIVGALEKHIEQFVGPEPDALLFTTRRAGTRLSASAYGPPFKAAAKAAGVPHVRIHDLRHLGATLAARAGATTKELMTRLGHKTPEMSMRYQHAAAGRDASIAAAMSALVEAPNPAEPTDV